MMGVSYEEIVSKIKDEKGLSDADIEAKINERRNKLSGLISKEGAAHIIANELGLDLLEEVRKRGLKIGKLQAGMRIGVVGKVVKLYGVRSFQKGERSGKVGSFLIGDDTGLLRIVFWDDSHISHLESGEIKEGSVVKLTNGNIKLNNGYKEMHLGNYGQLEINPEGFEDIKVANKQEVSSDANAEICRLGEVGEGQFASVYATVVQMFEPRFYEGCGDCFRKIVDGKCAQHPGGEIKKIPILNLYIDDGSEVMRAVAFNDQAKTLTGLNDEEIGALETSIDSFNRVKEELLGEQMVFNGKVATNNYSNRKEFMIRGASKQTSEILNKIVR